MREALGGDGYKSACNLFYMSKHVADMIDMSSTPVFHNVREKKDVIPIQITKNIDQFNR